jgi:hypothetical protein
MMKRKSKKEEETCFDQFNNHRQVQRQVWPRQSRNSRRCCQKSHQLIVVIIL